MITGIQAEMAKLRKGVAELEARAIKKVSDAAIVVIEELQKATPVYSGETVRNYGVVTPTGSTSYASEINNGDPGNTSKMPLGPEPRRADNSAAAISAVRSLLAGMKSLGTVKIVNHVSDQKWDLVDSGSAPTADRARYPGGVSIIGEASARSRLGGDWR